MTDQNVAEANGTKAFVTRAIAAGAGLAVYLGLAVLGEGGFRSFFSHPALTALVVANFVLMIAALFTEGNLSSGKNEDKENRWVLIAFSLIGLLDGILPAWTDRLNFWTFGGETLRWYGVAICFAGGALRIWPVFILGRRFSGLVAIQEDHALKTDGLYGVIRNPSYLGLLINMLGWGLAFRSGVGLLIVALTVPFIVVRIGAEEKMLRGHFGAEFDAYCAKTWRLVPGIY